MALYFIIAYISYILFLGIENLIFSAVCKNPLHLILIMTGMYSMDFASIIRLNSVLATTACTTSIIIQSASSEKKKVSIRQTMVLKHKTIILPGSVRMPFL